MYLNLKKAFSLYCGIKVRADLLCIRKSAQGARLTLQPLPQGTWSLRKCAFPPQSAYPEVFQTGYKLGLEPFLVAPFWPPAWERR